MRNLTVSSMGVALITVLLLAGLATVGAAAGDTVTNRIEAETMAVRSVGGNDGPAWNLWSNGMVGDELTVAQPARVRFVVSARSRSTIDVVPLMEFRLDDQVVGTAAVEANEAGAVFRPHVFEADVAAGVHEFAVAFVNDVPQPGVDLDLLVDWVDVSIDVGGSSTSTTATTIPTIVIEPTTTTIATTTTIEPTTTEPQTPEPSTPNPTSVEPTTSAPTTEPTEPPNAGEEENLALLRRSSVRNTNHDRSAFRDTPQAQLSIENHLGPRSEYLGNPGGNPEQHFPTRQGGNFRVTCEFSHFAYDDPLVFPNQPGRSHLHMFFGNTDANAFSTYDSLINRGGGTCNGQELNRTAYWAPAMFDAQGNVRIPHRINVYYKGYGQTLGRAQTYPEGAAMIVTDKVHELPMSEGGNPSEIGFRCTNQYRGQRNPVGDTIPRCVADRGGPIRVLEVDIKFPQCWNGQDPSNPDNFRLARGGWFRSDCQGDVNLPNLEYLIGYELAPGESTEGWYLASDIDPATGLLRGEPGSTVHADWWGGWHPEVNRQFIDNCVNFQTNAPSGCGHGYLSDAGPDNENPFPGPALRMRPQYTGPDRVAAATLFEELCITDRVFRRAEDATYCRMSTP